MANSEFITILKRKIKNEIVNDPLIVKAFGSPDYDETDLDFSGEDVGENYIFSWDQDTKTIKETMTFITLQVNIKTYRENWVKPQLIITIYSHSNHMKLNPKEFPGIDANRNDYLSQLLDDKFNGRTTIGLEYDPDRISLMGKFELSENYEGVLNNSFAYRQLIFETKDLNYSLCDGR